MRARQAGADEPLVERASLTTVATTGGADVYALERLCRTALVHPEELAVLVGAYQTGDAHGRPRASAVARVM